MVWILIKILKSSPLIKWFKDYPGNLYATIKTSGGEVILQKTQNYWRMEFPTAYVQRSKYNKLIYELVRRSNKELKIHFDILLDLMSENFDLNRIIQREAPQRSMPRPPPPRRVGASKGLPASSRRRRLRGRRPVGRVSPPYVDRWGGSVRPRPMPSSFAPVAADDRVLGDDVHERVRVHAAASRVDGLRLDAALEERHHVLVGFTPAEFLVNLPRERVHHCAEPRHVPDDGRGLHPLHHPLFLGGDDGRHRQRSEIENRKARPRGQLLTAQRRIKLAVLDISVLAVAKEARRVLLLEYEL